MNLDWETFFFSFLERNIAHYVSKQHLSPGWNSLMSLLNNDKTSTKFSLFKACVSWDAVWFSAGQPKLGRIRLDRGPSTSRECSPHTEIALEAFGDLSDL